MHIFLGLFLLKRSGMKNELSKIGFGGGCHWCTEAIFQSLKGVVNVKQGFIAQKEEKSSFSEAVIITYNSLEISLKDLMEIHLHTHKSSSSHSLRNKYRSAIYSFDEKMFNLSKMYLDELQLDFKDKLISKVYRFKTFKYGDDRFRNYFYSNPEKPFCKTYISPKLKLLLQKFSKHVDTEKINISF